MLNILSWNIRQGGGSRINLILQFILKQKAQIVILSEFRNNDKGNNLRNTLLKYDYKFQAVPQTQKDENCVLIASKLPFNSKLYYDNSIDYSYGIVSAKFQSFYVYGVYLPHKKKHKLFDVLNQEILENKPSIIAGDFNSGINKVDQKGDSFWYEKDFKKLLKNEMTDAFRFIHKDKLEYSWYSHGGNGFRYDHTLVHKDLLPIVNECIYLHEAREENISDHSPMILKLG